MTERYTLGYFDPAPRSPKTPEPLSPRFNWDELLIGIMIGSLGTLAIVCLALRLS